ncbi:hypothetical protein [Rhodococcus sp. A5(2022)]|uniref:hypothetical protein n=1 Tax=Rhodococcus sp. A5(2022) TaxID=3003588 RepID=UPI0022A8432F|nr:hypothetical protein [Rhodococcus sp. A5(2022)]MCZ1070823.1 hypothetical protein [Rhodococcus sp. A5(2022)]
MQTSRFRRIAGVLLTVTSLSVIGVGCSSDEDNSDGERTIRGQIDGQNVRVDLPTAGTLQGLAVWFHGQSGTVDTRMNEDWLNALRAQGWAVASGDLGGDAWGNQDAITAASALTEWATDQAGVPVRLLVAGSMGALTSLNALTHGAIAADCWYGTMPVLDQSTVGNVPESSDQLRKAFGGSIPGEFTPAESSLPPLRYRVLASPEDTWVPKTSNADLLADLVPETANVTTLEVSGEHGDPSHFDADDLAAFAGECI